jgi:hypothetical protein
MKGFWSSGMLLRSEGQACACKHLRVGPLIIPVESLRVGPHNQGSPVIAASDSGDGDIAMLRIRGLLESVVPAFKPTLIYSSNPPIVKTCINPEVLEFVRLSIPQQIRNTVSRPVVSAEICRMCEAYEGVTQQ